MARVGQVLRVGVFVCVCTCLCVATLTPALPGQGGAEQFESVCDNGKVSEGGREGDGRNNYSVSISRAEQESPLAIHGT